jgi:uncharacterized cupin superfamily protein
MLRKQAGMECTVYAPCHDGIGRIISYAVLKDGDCGLGNLCFMHDNTLEPGASIGEHSHEKGEESEEIYFIVEGHGRMILDGKPYPVSLGCVSAVKPGHSHGIVHSPRVQCG